MALTKPEPGVEVLDESPADRRAEIVHPPLRATDLRLHSVLLDLLVSCLLVVLALQVPRLPTGLV